MLAALCFIQQDADTVVPLLVERLADTIRVFRTPLLSDFPCSEPRRDRPCQHFERSQSRKIRASAP